MDGADQSAHDLPKLIGRLPKDMEVCSQKIQGLIFHGREFHAYSIPSFVRPSANLTLTCLLRSLQKILPVVPEVMHTLYMQVDGGSDEWCKATLAIVDLMFDVYPDLKEAYVSRLGVSKTHQDIDRAFGYLNSAVYGTGPGGDRAGVEVITRDEFASLFHKAMSDKKDTMYLKTDFEDMNFSYDFWSS